MPADHVHCWLADYCLSHAMLCLVAQGHLAEVKQLKDLITKQERKAVTSETLVDKLQRQLAESSTRVSSLTSTLEAAQKSHKNTVQVLLQL